MILVFWAVMVLNNCMFAGNPVDADHNNFKMAVHKNKVISQTDQYQIAYETTLKLWPVPYEELNIATSYGKSHIIISGPKDAPPVVLLHGMNASSTMWYPNIGVISENHRIYAVDDITEPGRSKLSEPLNGTEDLLNWYIELVDKLGLEKFILIGASKGGWLAVKLAIQVPDRVDKLVLLSPLQTFSNIPVNLKFFSALRYAINPNRKTLYGVLRTMSTNSSNIDPRYIEQFYLGSRIAEHRGLLFKLKPFGRAELEKLNMPVLILIGDRDIINNKRTTEKACESISEARTSVIPDAGHFLSMDQIDITNDRMVEFMKSPYAVLADR